MLFLIAFHKRWNVFWLLFWRTIAVFNIQLRLIKWFGRKYQYSDIFAKPLTTTVIAFNTILVAKKGHASHLQMLMQLLPEMRVAGAVVDQFNAQWTRVHAVHDVGSLRCEQVQLPHRLHIYLRFTLQFSSAVYHNNSRYQTNCSRSFSTPSFSQNQSRSEISWGFLKVR